MSARDNSAARGAKAPYADLAPFLKHIDQHVVWRIEHREVKKTGEMKPTKVPYSVNFPDVTIRAGEGYSIAPRCWTSFTRAIDVVKLSAMKFAGIGIVFGDVPRTDEFIWGIDLDNCFEADGTLREWAVPLIAALLGTYLETSPSYTGIKAFIRSKVDQFAQVAAALGIHAGKSREVTFAQVAGEKDQKIEIYLGGRYFAETGLHYAGSASDVALLDLTSLEAVGALLPIPEDEASKSTTIDAPATLEDIADAVASIPVDMAIGELSVRAIRLRVVMGIHYEMDGSDEGFTLAHSWASGSKSFNEAKLVQAWKGFKHDRDNPITAGTIFYIAGLFGWKRIPRVPATSKMFAGMTHDDLFADIYRVVEQNCWWSVSRRAIMKTDALNDALSGIYRPAIAKLRNQPRNYTDWLKAMRRVATYKGLIYRSGQPAICESAPGAGDEMVNLWQPPPAIPQEIRDRIAAEGDAAVEYWLTLIGDACNDDRRLIDHVLDWFAFVRVRLDLKPGWHIIMRTGAFGTGKDMICSIFMLAMGDGNCTMIYRSDLSGQFNDWAEKKFGVIEELRTTTRGTMTGGDIFNALQPYTANEPPRFKVNRKNIVPYMADNLIALVITTNSRAPMAIPLGDRRWLILAGREIVRPKEFYAKCAAWKASPNVGHLISAWLEARWESMNDERRGAVQWHAPASDAKTLMIEATEDPVIGYARAALTTEFGIDAWPDLMSPTDIVVTLRAAQDNSHIPRNVAIPSVTRIGRWAIENLGAKPVPLTDEGEHLVSHRPDAKTVRLYAMRRHEIYAGLSARDLGKRYASKTWITSKDGVKSAKPRF